VRRDVAVTGEVTLRGKVLEIGGVKEKVLAAYRAGLREVILPAANEKDLRGLPDIVREQMKIGFARSMDDVMQAMLLARSDISAARDDLWEAESPTPQVSALSVKDTEVPKGMGGSSNP
jgi:ATP-dependent Lon protease